MPQALHPLRLRPTFRERPWGVHNLGRWFPQVEVAAPIGEAWFTANDNLTDHDEPLGGVIARDPAAILGRAARGSVCPLLVKLLFTSERLSVQVHPDDEYAARHHGGALGKTEAWHVLHAAPGAQIGLGFTEPLTPARARAAAQSGEIERLLAWLPAQSGDTFLVPAGTVHAIGGGLTILEIQEHSDTTYRLYDYGRPRELHLDHGLAVARLDRYTVDNRPAPIAPGRTLLTSCDHFILEYWRISGSLAFEPIEPYCHVLVPLDGRITIDDRAAAGGDVFLVPAASSPFTVHGDGASVVVAYTSRQLTAALRAVNA